MFSMSGVEVVSIFLIFYGTLALVLFFLVRWAWRASRASGARAAQRTANRSELLELREELDSLRTDVGSLQEQQDFFERLLQRQKEPRG